MGYETLSAPGRAVAEVVELMVWDEVAKARASIHPGAVAPAGLLHVIANRFTLLNSGEQSAVIDLLRKPSSLEGNAWKDWLVYHLQKFPGDAEELYLLQENFGGGFAKPSWHVVTKYGTLSRPWQMDHAKAYGRPAIVTLEERLATLTPSEKHIYLEAEKAFQHFEKIMDGRTGK